MDERAAFQHAARWLLRHETGGCDDAAGLALAADEALRRLAKRFSVLLGPFGVRTLMARALETGHAQHPFLRTVRLQPAPGLALEGLTDAVVGVDPAEVCHGLTAVLDASLGLLANLVGADLVAREARRIWPQVPAEMLRPVAEAAHA